MSLHWTLIAGFLYAEIATILVLLIPFVSNRAWNKLFKSSFLKGLGNQTIYYFYVLVAILVLFFLDAIREMRKYSDESVTDLHSHGAHLDSQMQMHMRLFRAQRNFYISGFALFLCLVIRRLVGLIMTSASLEAEREAAMKQATSASRAAETLMDAGAAGGDGQAVKELEQKLKTASADLSKAKKDVESMKAQSENLASEYDRVSEERNQFEKKLRIASGGAGADKKDD
jgi:B-cell receptor-associated protein 31